MVYWTENCRTWETVNTWRANIQKDAVERVYDWMIFNKRFNIMLKNGNLMLGRAMQSRSLMRWKESNADASGDTNGRNQNEEEDMTLRTERSVVFAQSYRLVDMDYLLFVRMTIFGDVMWRISIQKNTTTTSYAYVLFQTRSTWIHHDGFPDDPHSKWSYIHLLYDEEFEWESRDQTVWREQWRGDFSRGWKVCSDWLNEFIFLKY